MLDYTDQMREYDEYESQQGNEDGLDTQRERRNADGRTSRQQAALERRARFAYGHDCDM